MAHFKTPVRPKMIGLEHPETDVAVTPARFPNKFDGRYIPSGLLATKDFISKNQIAEGDDVFFCGMFQGYPGQQRMQPVIRFGNISLMPHEKVTLRDSKEDSPYSTEAYLVESRSWGGHSGSPTWLYLNPNRFPGQIVFQQGTPNFVLLGLVAAHFELPQNVDFVGDILEGGTVNINAGLAIVIPAHFILDLLMRDELVEHRQQIEKTGGK